MAYHRAGLNTGIARIFNTYGERMRPNDGRALPNFMTQALTNQGLTVFGSGAQTRSLCYVSDLIRGIVLLLDSDEHFPVNLGNPTEITMLELAKRVLALTGGDGRIVFRDLPEDDPKQRCPDITRARTILGWKPTVTLDDGLARTLSWFQSELQPTA